MMMDNYVYIPITALCCYSFLLLSFMAAKKNKLINSFLLFLAAMILWTGGSFCMRMQLWPDLKFWYDVSIMGLTLMPLAFYMFVVEFIELKNYRFKLIYFLCVVLINILNISTGFFLKAPDPIYSADGSASFVYNISWTLWILFGFCIVVTLHALFLLFKHSKSNELARKQFMPIVFGVLVLVIGHLALFVPVFRGFPTDILSGVGFAFFLFYALYKRRLFKLTLLVSRGSCYGIAAGLSLLLFSNFIGLIQAFINYSLPNFVDHSVLIIAVFFAMATFLIYLGMKRFIDKIFTKEEILQAEKLKEFSSNVSKSLDVNEILAKLVDIIHKTISVKKIYICIRDESKNAFVMAHSTSPLDKQLFGIQNDNPIVLWLSKNNGCLLMKDFKRTIAYKSMWEDEKRQLAELMIECFVPLKDEEDLVGVVLLSSKEKHSSYTHNDINFLESVDSIASIAVRNSRLYEKVYNEARTDELTGLLNRKYFYETIHNEYEKNKNHSLALIILNIDDFKLYNQLYGNREGDIALQKIAKIIRVCVGGNGHVARYSGKEFAIILPMYDLLGAKNLAEIISLQIGDMNKRIGEYSFKTLTVSGGICSIPYAASSVKELINNADRAIYHIKRTGKNAIMTYSERDQSLMAGNVNTDTLRIKSNAYSDYEAAIYALTAAIDAKDHYTFDHSNNVAYYAIELAHAYGMNLETVEMIREAALLHDIGKIGIPEHILNKPGELTEDEYEIIKGHVENSIDIIRHLPSLDYVIPAVMGHHERYDGLGYPRRIAKEDIPVSARILCIVDSFDAMISERSYKDAYTVSRALEIIEEEAGLQFDPVLAHLFVDAVRNQLIEVKVSEYSVEVENVKKMVKIQ
jgi:diguanylate cyclase (GGDEF)-like protein/putative nucleotidyltransferase with HDIG domain